MFAVRLRANLKKRSLTPVCTWRDKHLVKVSKSMKGVFPMHFLKWKYANFLVFSTVEFSYHYRNQPLAILKPYEVALFRVWTFGRMGAQHFVEH
jgi:hypothetical protein